MPFPKPTGKTIEFPESVELTEEDLKQIEKESREIAKHMKKVTESMETFTPEELMIVIK